MTETQERFLRTILSRVPLESVVELHLFPPIRRGTVETGVAVIATVMPPALVVDASPAIEAEPDALDELSPYAADPAEAVSVGDDTTPIDDTEPVYITPTGSPRMCILTASYRHTIKGLERGKWVADVQEEADAPLDAVEAVLRGVRHRSTEPADPELVSHDTLAALLAQAAVAPAA